MNPVLEASIRALVFDVVLKRAIEAAVKSVPFLGWPVVNQVVTYIVKKILVELYEELSRFVSFTLIDWKTKQQQQDYEEAVAKYKAAQESANAEQVKQAQETFKSTLRDLIRLQHS